MWHTHSTIKPRVKNTSKPKHIPGKQIIAHKTPPRRRSFRAAAKQFRLFARSCRQSFVFWFYLRKVHFSLRQNRYRRRLPGFPRSYIKLVPQCVHIKSRNKYRPKTLPAVLSECLVLTWTLELARGKSYDDAQETPRIDASDAFLGRKMVDAPGWSNKTFPRWRLFMIAGLR